jgi:hypothetical protein
MVSLFPFAGGGGVTTLSVMVAESNGFILMFPALLADLPRQLAGERKLLLGFIALVLVSLFLVPSRERILGSHHSATVLVWFGFLFVCLFFCFCFVFWFFLVLKAIAGLHWSSSSSSFREFLFLFGWYTMVRILLALSKGHRQEHQWHLPSSESLWHLWHQAR